MTEGHPDKVCDQISDAILDDLLAQDSSSHVAVETSAATGVFLIFGEVTSKGTATCQSKVRETLRNIGYTSSEVGLERRFLRRGRGHHRAERRNQPGRWPV